MENIKETLENIRKEIKENLLKGNFNIQNIEIPDEKEHSIKTTITVLDELKYDVSLSKESIYFYGYYGRTYINPNLEEDERVILVNIFFDRIRKYINCKYENDIDKLKNYID